MGMTREQAIMWLVQELEKGDTLIELSYNVVSGVVELLKAHVLSVADIVDNHITPKVIWVELREDSKVLAGLWTGYYYEMEDGGDVLSDLGEEIASYPELYGTKWRVWDKEPTKEEREAVKWDG